MHGGDGTLRKLSCVRGWAIAALIALGCSSSREPSAQAPCGGPDTCPSGFLCQDRGRGDGYRCYRDDEEDADADAGASGRASMRRDAAVAAGASGGDSGRAGSAAGDGGTMRAGAGGGPPVGGSGGSAGNGSSGSSAGGSGGSSGGGGTGTPGCEPWVLFVIDGSGSMCAPFDGATRWSAVRDALVGADGLITRNAARADFGLLVFDGTIDLALASSAVGGSPSPQCAGMYTAMRASGSCPQLIQTPVARDNAQAITAMYPMAELGGSTPTDKALDVAVDQALAASATSKAIVLVSDGQPNDLCIGGVGGDGSAQKAGVLAAVDRAAAGRIRTHALNMSANDAALTAHLNDVAHHGALQASDASALSPTSRAELTTKLDELMARILACR